MKRKAGISDFKPKKVDIPILNEIQTLREEIIASNVVLPKDITINTVLVYAALKSKVTDENIIRKMFLISIPAIRKELLILAPIKYSKFHIYKDTKTTPKITLGTIDPTSIVEEKNIIIEQKQQETIKIPLAIPVVADKKSKLLRLRM